MEHKVKHLQFIKHNQLQVKDQQNGISSPYPLWRIKIIKAFTYREQRTIQYRLKPNPIVKRGHPKEKRTRVKDTQH